MPKLSRKERLEMLIEMDEALSQHRLFKSTFMKRYNLTEQNVGAYLRLLEEIGQAIDDERVRIFI